MPILSVIIPVYNTEKFLAKAIESVLNQTYRDLEVIIINDGSTDGSGEICDRYAQRDNRVYVIHKKNEGQGVARNLGISCAKGEYITFLDSDDYIDIDAYKNVIEASIKNDIDINRFVYNQFSTETKHEDVLNYEFPEIYNDEVVIRQAALCLFSKPIDKHAKDLNWGGSACCAIYRRNLLIDNNIKFPQNSKFVCEDFIFNFYCLQYANRVGVSKTPYYHYRLNFASTTHKPNLNMVDKCVDTCRLLEDEFRRFGYNEDAIDYAHGFSIDFLRSYLKNICLSAMPLKSKLQWIKSQSRYTYFKSVYKNYNWRMLPLKHKLHFLSFYHGHALVLYLMITSLEKIRYILCLMLKRDKYRFGNKKNHRL